jgi:NAD(P)-dependent dehydrogenase (short-subunit alcohol dehydrogenase family)
VALAAEGAKVAVVARTEQVWNDKLPGTIGETVAEIEAAGGHAVAIRADLTDRADVARLVDEARAALGPITLLVNNAAFTAPGRPPVPGAPAPAQGRQGCRVAGGLAAVRRHPGARVPAAFRDRGVRGLRTDAIVVPDMLDAGGGAIVNISSIASRIPGAGPFSHFASGILPGYGGSKAALEHLTESAAYDLQRRNISVNALSRRRP